jgi:hypothetical protein
MRACDNCGRGLKGHNVPLTQSVFELGTFWTRCSHAELDWGLRICCFSSTYTWISYTRGTFFLTHTVAVCFGSTCVKTMAECQTLDRDGERRVTELTFEWQWALKSGGNPLPTVHDVITLPAGGGTVIADRGMTRHLSLLHVQIPLSMQKTIVWWFLVRTSWTGWRNFRRVYLTLTCFMFRLPILCGRFISS